MFVDASALVAILLREPEADAFANRLAEAEAVFTSPVAAFETVVAIMRNERISRYRAEAKLAENISAANITVMDITPEIGRLALDAFERYGKGRGHPAQLNMGDCFAYACARAKGVPLLYKGDDFARTDLA